MAKLPSTKRVQIDKANTTIVVVTSVAAFILVFCAVATKTLASQAAYQNRVMDKKRVAVKELKANVTAGKGLQAYYNAFANTPTNIIGGTAAGTGDNDGSNVDIILDALPSSYDFPALVTSLDSLMSQQGVQISGIGGTDDEVAQAAQTSSDTPAPIAMPFEVTVAGNYDSVRGMVDAFEKSVRPMQVQSMRISAQDKNQLGLDLSAQTFYQPAKTLNIAKKAVK